MKKGTVCKLLAASALIAATAYLAKKSELFTDDAAAYAPFEPKQD